MTSFMNACNVETLHQEAIFHASEPSCPRLPGRAQGLRCAGGRYALNLTSQVPERPIVTTVSYFSFSSSCACFCLCFYLEPRA